MQTYGDLKTSLADWIDRLDLTAQIPQFVRLAEGDIYRELRCKHNEFTAEYTSTGWTLNGEAQGAWTAGLFLSLPQNYKEIKLVSWNDQPLAMVSEQNMRTRLLNGSDAEPIAYSEVARAFIFSIGISSDPTEWDEGDSLKYTYYGVESLDSFPTWQTAANPVDNPAVEDTTPENLTQTDANTTRLLQHAPDLYLSGALMWAYRYLNDPAKVAEWSAVFREQGASLDTEDAELTGSTVQVTGIYGD